MEKQITISYKEYLELQSKIERLKTQEINKEKELYMKAFSATFKCIDRRQLELVERRLNIIGIEITVVSKPQEDSIEVFLKESK